MRGKTKIKALSGLLPVFGLALLLLLSPCKVRNFIQAELDIAKTKVVSKNKTTLNNNNCSDLDIVADLFSKEKPAPKLIPLYPTAVEWPLVVHNTTNNYIQPTENRNRSVARVPLYILYQNFKDYL